MPGSCRLCGRDAHIPTMFCRRDACTPTMLCGRDAHTPTALLTLDGARPVSTSLYSCDFNSCCYIHNRGGCCFAGQQFLLLQTGKKYLSGVRCVAGFCKIRQFRIFKTCKIRQFGLFKICKIRQLRVPKTCKIRQFVCVYHLFIVYLQRITIPHKYAKFGNHIK